MTRAIVRTVAVVTLTAVTVNELNNMAIVKGKKGEFREMRDTVSSNIDVLQASLLPFQFLSWIQFECLFLLMATDFRYYW